VAAPYIVDLLLKFSLAQARIAPEDWMFKVLHTSGLSVSIGWSFVWFACAAAPSRKLQIAKVLAVLISSFMILGFISAVINGESSLGFSALEALAVSLGAGNAFVSIRTNETRNSEA